MKTAHQILSLSALVALGLAPSLARAAPSIDLAKDLSDPKTRLMAVTFVGPRCTQCKAERASFKRLLRKYRGDGMRVTVVVEPNKRGRCRSPGWSPSRRICDRGGKLKKRFGVEKLPASYLWTWRGALRVNGGSAADVVKSTQTWLNSSLRVAIHEVKLPEGERTAEELRYLLRAELQATGKVTLLASEAERAALRDAQRRSMGRGADPRRAARVGRDLTENAQLSAGVLAGQLYLQLFDVDLKKMVTQGQAAWDPAAPQLAVKQAVKQLLAGLKQPLETPKGGTIAGWMDAPKPAPLPKEVAPKAEQPVVLAPPTASPVTPAVIEPAASTPVAPNPAPVAAAPALAEDDGYPNTRISLAAGLGLRQLVINDSSAFGGGLNLHTEWGLRNAWLGFGLTADLGLLGYGSGVVELPLSVGIRGYLWRFFIGFNGGLNILGGKNDSWDGGEMSEKIAGAEHGVVAIPVGYSGERWEVFLDTRLEFYADGERDEVEQLTGEDETNLRTLSMLVFVGRNF